HDIRRFARPPCAVPIFRRMLADQMTPVSAFAALSQGADRAFLLESVVGGEHIARYSIVGSDPGVAFSAGKTTAAILRPGGIMELLHSVRDPLAELQGLLSGYNASAVPREALGGIATPRFTGGAVGFAGYDTIRYYEKLGKAPRDDRNLDDLDF